MIDEGVFGEGGWLIKHLKQLLIIISLTFSFGKKVADRKNRAMNFEREIIFFHWSNWNLTIKNYSLWQWILYWENLPLKINFNIYVSPKKKKDSTTTNK